MKIVDQALFDVDKVSIGETKRILDECAKQDRCRDNVCAKPGGLDNGMK